MKAERFMKLKKLTSVSKTLTCLGFTVVAFFIAHFFHIDVLSQVMIAWNTFSLVLLSIDWIIFYNTPPAQLHKQAQVEDTSRFIIFIIVLISTLASLLAVTILLLKSSNGEALHIIIAVLGMALSWATVHTLYTVHYAHMYYGGGDKKNIPSGGLDFPNEGDEKNDNPDFLDFAYFSFVLGMTFQVSDVVITSRKLRRAVLIHSLISFAYNAVIVALTINALADFK